MLKRTISGIVGVALVVVLMIYNLQLPWLLNVALALIACVALYEVLVATMAIKNPAIAVVCFAFTAALQFIPAFGRQSVIYMVATVSVAFLLILFMIALFSRNTVGIDKIAMVMLTTSMVAFPFFSLLYMYWKNPFNTYDYAVGQAMVIFCVLIAWLTDIGAYFSGFLFGKHKLCPDISPKKTVEGAIGGVVLCVGLCSLIAWLLTVKFKVTPIEVHWHNMLIVVFFGSLISMLGDLSFSLVKRYFHIKDFGHIMPGHGGVLDRFDSVLFVAPMVCVVNLYLPIIVTR